MGLLALCYVLHPKAALTQSAGSENPFWKKDGVCEQNICSHVFPEGDASARRNC